MYAHVENGSIDYMGSLPKNWRNISGLILSDGDNTFLKTIGWLPVTETNVTPAYNEVYDTDQITINADNVQLVHRVKSMTAQEKSDRDASHLQSMRQQRDEKLVETDFYALSDVTMSADMETYRQALRDLPATADMTKWETAEWAWPTKPS